MTESEYYEILDAIEKVDLSIPIKKFPASEWTVDKVVEWLTRMKKCLKNDSSLYEDVMWMDQLTYLQGLADYYGICVE